MAKDLINRSFEKVKCPHCNKEMMIGIDYKLPSVGGVKTIDEANKVKDIIKGRIAEIKFASEEDLNELIEWIDKEEVIFGEEDIEPLLKHVAIEQNQKMSKT